MKPSGRISRAHPVHAITTALLGSARSDGRSRWSMCAWVIRMTSRLCNCAGASGGAVFRRGPMVSSEPIESPTRLNSVGSLSTRTPHQFISSVEWPRSAIVSV